MLLFGLLLLVGSGRPKKQVDKGASSGYSIGVLKCLLGALTFACACSVRRAFVTKTTRTTTTTVSNIHEGNILHYYS